MSLTLPVRRKTHSFLPKNTNALDVKLIRQRERMNRVKNYHGIYRSPRRFTAEKSTLLQYLMSLKDVCCFNENSWHISNSLEISKFIINKNGKRILLFSNKDNKHAGFVCKLHTGTNFEQLLKIILSTKFPDSDKENFLIFFMCRQFRFAIQLQPLLNNGFFFERFLKLLSNGNCMFEL